MQENNFQTDFAVGIIPYHKKQDTFFVLLVQKQGPWWGFPKGHKESEETDMQAAVRETKEETNLSFHTVLETPVFTEEYTFIKNDVSVCKKVCYFVGEVHNLDAVKCDGKEVLASKWLPLAQAIEHLSYESTKRVLKDFSLFVNKNL